MNVAEDYDDITECLNMHPDLLPPGDNEGKLLESGSVVFHKALKTDEKTGYFTETENFPTGTIDNKAMILQVLDRLSPPHNYCRRVTGFLKYVKWVLF